MKYLKLREKKILVQEKKEISSPIYLKKTVKSHLEASEERFSVGIVKAILFISTSILKYVFTVLFYKIISSLLALLSEINLYFYF